MTALRRQPGFTLIELMVGMALGMLVLLALMTLIANVSRNQAEMSRTNSVIENGRFALQVLESDLSHSGFWGSWVPQFDDLSLGTSAPNDSPATTADNTVPDPCASYAGWTAAYRSKLVGIPVQVYEVPISGTPPVCASVLNNAQSGATGTAARHMLVVRHAAPCTATASATDIDCRAEAGNDYFQVQRCGSTAGSTFAQSTDAALANFTLQNRDCATVASSYRYISNIYYIRNYAVTVGDGIPTLVRSSFTGTAHGTPTPLVEGVEAMRVELGVDKVSKSGVNLAISDFNAPLNWADASRLVTPVNRGDGNPDATVNCTSGTPCTAFDLMNVVVVRVYVLARATTSTPGYTSSRTYALGATTFGPFTDNFKRHVYSRTIRLHNVAMRREVPPGS